MQYPGEELDAFALAGKWKRYWASLVRPFLGCSVLEVGAGIGTNTQMLCGAGHSRWVCLEPDPKLLSELRRRLTISPPAGCWESRLGTLADLGPDERFDAIVYIDVLEHLDDDAAELEKANRHLNPGGRLVVLAPAHGWLFSPFDAAIGHRRRYTRKTLTAAAPRKMTRLCLRYLDAVGMSASLLNRLMLRQRTPSERQILFWDRVMVPISRRLDPLFRYRLGKSLLGVWAS